MPAGSALATIPWLQTRFGLGFELWNCYFFSIARYHAFWFLGAYSRWLPMPNPTRFVPDWGRTPLAALSHVARGINTWLHVVATLVSELAASLQQASQSGPALASGLSSLLLVDPCDPSWIWLMHIVWLLTGAPVISCTDLNMLLLRLCLMQQSNHGTMAILNDVQSHCSGSQQFNEIA